VSFNPQVSSSDPPDNPDAEVNKIRYCILIDSDYGTGARWWFTYGIWTDRYDVGPRVYDSTEGFVTTCTFGGTHTQIWLYDGRNYYVVDTGGRVYYAGYSQDIY